MEVHNQAAALERQLRRGANQVCVFLSFGTWEKNSALMCGCPCIVFICTDYVYPQDCSEYVQFLRESHSEALKEEERRHRFLAEKHCGLIQSIAQLMNKVYNLLTIFLFNILWVCFVCQMGRVCHTKEKDNERKDNSQ